MTHYFPEGHEPAMRSQSEWEDFLNAEDYINHEERLKITLRIVDLFPKIGVGTADGLITADELMKWNL